jgi:sulfofructose kinase
MKADYNRLMGKLAKVDLVGVGLNATDTLIGVADFPARGSKVEYTLETVMPGGQVASAVVACQLWGLTTRYVGKLGNDDAARLHEREFARTGVEAHLIHVPDVASPKSTILIDRFGERTVLCRRDNRLILRAEELEREWIVNSRVLHLDGHDTAAATCAAQWARAAGIPVVADLDELYPEVERLIENVDYLIVSRDFPARLMKEDDLHLALRKMRFRFGCTFTAATLGADGVLAFDGNDFYHRAAYRVPVTDTTGAGDVFHAGFIFGLLQGWDMEHQLDFACAAAAINCTAEGARGCIQSVGAIEAMIKANCRYQVSAIS